MAQDKKIEDYLHLYLDCQIKSLDGGTMKYKLTGFDVEGLPFFKTVDGGFSMYLSKWKPILRKLSDMSEEEKRLLYAMGSQRYEGGIVQMLNLNCFDPFQTVWLLSLHIDLFGLIEAGLAIDKTTIK